MKTYSASAIMTSASVVVCMAQMSLFFQQNKHLTKLPLGKNTLLSLSLHMLASNLDFKLPKRFTERS